MIKTIATATLVLALGLSATGAQAQSRTDLTAGSNQSQVGMLLPAVQSVREAAARSTSASDSGPDLLIVNNGEGSDFLEAELRNFFRSITPME